MDIREIEELRRTREAEYRKDLEAIDRVMRMLAPQAPVKQPVDTTAIRQTLTELRQEGAELDFSRSPAFAVRSSLSVVPENFSIEDVRAYLKTHFPSIETTAANLSPALARLAKQGLIEPIKKGSGKVPTIYRLLRKPDGAKPEEGQTT